MPRKITQRKDPYRKSGSTFARIQTGDITKWAKGTNRFQYPEPRNTKSQPQRITSLAACVMHSVAEPPPDAVVMLGADFSPKTVSDSCDGLDAVGIASMIAARLASVGRRRGLAVVLRES